jgi:hypothetical protein
MRIGKVTKLFSGLAAGLALAAGAQAQVQYGNLDRIAFQFDNQQQQRGGGSIVGDWHQTKQISSGGVLHMYFTYGPDGSFRYTSLQVGGALNANGTRTQVWGRYQAQPQQDGTLLVTYRLTGHAPTQTCMPGQGCHQNGVPPSGATTDTIRIHGNTLEVGGSQMQREAVPQALQAQLPATWTLQPPPPLPPPDHTSGRGGRYIPMTPSVGKSCPNNHMEEEKCYLNDGYLSTDREGCEHCTKNY